MDNRFTINSAHQSFTDKQKDLFASLENAEKSAPKLIQNQQMEVDDKEDNKPEFTSKQRDDRRRDRNECSGKSDKNPRMRQYKSRESIFKRPEAPISRCLPHGRTPGFRKNPNQWTKYTLEDVKDEDMSDRSNTQAAFSFLKSLEKSKSESEEKLDSLPEKIIFKKSSIIRKKQTNIEDKANEEEDKCSFRSSKVVMPEYVVGQAGKKDKKKKNKVISTSSSETSKVQLKLNHLDDEYEDDM